MPKGQGALRQKIGSLAAGWAAGREGQIGATWVRFAFWGARARRERSSDKCLVYRSLTAAIAAKRRGATSDSSSSCVVTDRLERARPRAKQNAWNKWMRKSRAAKRRSPGGGGSAFSGIIVEIIQLWFESASIIRGKCPHLLNCHQGNARRGTGTKCVDKLGPTPNFAPRALTFSLLQRARSAVEAVAPRRPAEGCASG